MNQTEKLEMQIQESQDGSAIVQLPPGAEPPVEGAAPADEPPAAHAEEADAGDDGGDDQRPEHNTEDGDANPEREAIREARREERKLKKQLHKEKARESNHLISALRKQNQELAQRLAIIEKKTSGAELARVEKAIDDAAVQVEFAKMKMQEAVSTSNGAELTRAQEMWFEARRKLESLQVLKDTASKQINAAPPTAPDPVVKRMAEDWMERNPWYDPQGKNIESEIAQKVDRVLTDEGFDPSSEEYWEELDERMKKYVPAARGAAYNNPNAKPAQRPRSMVTSSGRDFAPAAKPGEYVIDAKRVQAMKDAGLWDNPETRRRAIERYQAWDRQNKQAARS